MPALRSLKHERFCNEYTIDFNATQAATRTGYSEKSARVQGSKLLTNPAILSRVRELQAEQVERLAITSDWVLLKLTEVVEKAMRAKAVEKWDYTEKCLVETGEYVFDSQGANKALELVGKHLSMFTDKVEHSGGVVIIDDR